MSENKNLLDNKNAEEADLIHNDNAVEADVKTQKTKKTEAKKDMTTKLLIKKKVRRPSKYGTAQTDVGISAIESVASYSTSTTTGSDALEITIGDWVIVKYEVQRINKTLSFIGQI